MNIGWKGKMAKRHDAGRHDIKRHDAKRHDTRWHNVRRHLNESQWMDANLWTDIPGWTKIGDAMLEVIVPQNARELYDDG
jgi:hypothetical protein